MHSINTHAKLCFHKVIYTLSQHCKLCSKTLLKKPRTLLKKNLPTGYSFYTSRKHSCFQDCLFCSLNRELGHREQATLGDGQWYSVFDKIEMNPIRKPQERIFTPLGRSTGPSAISAFPKPFEELKRMTSSVSNETHT